MQKYTVQVNPPSKPSLLWDYPPRYFPRKFHYLADANKCAKTAITRGAELARVEYPDGREMDFRKETKS